MIGNRSANIGTVRENQRLVIPRWTTPRLFTVLVQRVGVVEPTHQTHLDAEIDATERGSTWTRVASVRQGPNLMQDQWRIYR